MSDETVGIDPSEDRSAARLGLTPGASTSIGPYKLLERLGEGGMGEVYLAEQTGPIHRKVALKIIKQGMDTREVIARFEAERQTLALMDHPCIARVFDAGATEQGRPYFVMEYVQGLPITDYCDRNKLGTRDRLKLFARVCDGVQHAHQKAIIHRDLKPGNVLVALEDGQPVPKLIDFGIAKATGQALNDQTMFTSVGQVIGTPEYMSPEQMELTGDNIDTRTDIYSLGVILYELLAGAPPFDAKDFRKDGIDAIRKRIREVDPPRPSTRVVGLGDTSTLSATNRQTVPGRLVSELKGDLDWITMKSLEKDRERRYETANALAQDIQRHLNDEPVLASPPSASYRLGKMVKRHRGAFVAITAVAVVLVVSSIVSTSLYFKAERESKRAREEASRATQVSTFMRDMLSGVGPSTALGRDTKMLREILDKTATRVDKELAGQPRVEAEMQTVLGLTYSDLGEFDVAEPHMARAHALLASTLGEKSSEALFASNQLASLYLQLGRLAAAESVLVKTIPIQEQVVGRDSFQTLASVTVLASVYAYQSQNEKAEPLARRAVDGLLKVRGDQNDQTQSAMFTLAGIYTDEQRYGAAESVYVALLGAAEREYGSENPNVLEGKVALGWVYRLDHRPVQAESTLSLALATMRRVLGNDHAQTLIAINDLGIVYSDLKQYDKAEPLYLENVSTSMRVQGPKNPETVASVVNLASFYDKVGRNAEAVTRATQAIEMFKGIVPDDFPGRGIAFMIRGMSRVKLGRADEAEQDLLEANKILLPQFGPDHPRIQTIRKNLHDLYEKRGDAKKAAEWGA